MCSNISIETTRSKRRSSTSSLTSAVTTSTLAGARASIHSRCKREFETAVMRASGTSAAKSANDPQPQPEVEDRLAVLDPGALAREGEHRLLGLGERLDTSRPVAGAVLEPGPQDRLEELGRDLVVLLVRLRGEERDRRAPQLRPRTPPSQPGPSPAHAEAGREVGADPEPEQRLGQRVRGDHRSTTVTRAPLAEPGHEGARLALKQRRYSSPRERSRLSSAAGTPVTKRMRVKP